MIIHGLAGIGVFILLVLGWRSLVHPIENQQYVVLQRMEQLETTLAAADSILDEHASLSERLAAARQLEASLKARIPDDPSEEEFLALVSQVAVETGLTIKDYRPGKTRNMPSCSAVEVQVIGQGDYESICRFLDGIAKLPRLSSIASLHVDASKDDKDYSVEITVLLHFGVAPQAQDGEQGRANA